MPVDVLNALMELGNSHHDGRMHFDDFKKLVIQMSV
jgi:hypothetical protein